MKAMGFTEAIANEVVSWWQKANVIYRVLVLGGALVVLAGGGYGGYRWYKINLEKNAQKSLNDCLYIYKEALAQSMEPAAAEKEQQKKNLWEEAEIALRLGYEQHKHSDLAPFFLALQSDASIHQGKNSEALEFLNKALSEISTSSPYHALYSIKRALLQIDDEALHEHGIRELEQLQQDKKNMFRDMTLFYLGSYYWSINELEKARFLLQELIDEYGSVKEGPGASPWVGQAHALLGNVSE